MPTRTDLALEAVNRKVIEFENLNQLAQFWDINYAHLWRLVNENYLSPKLDDFLVEVKVLDPRPKRHRICWEVGYGEEGENRKNRMYGWLEKHGYENFSEYMEEVIGEEE